MQALVPPAVENNRAKISVTKQQMLSAKCGVGTPARRPSALQARPLPADQTTC